MQVENPGLARTRESDFLTWAGIQKSFLTHVKEDLMAQVALDACNLNNRMPVKIEEGSPRSFTSQFSSRYSKAICNKDLS